MNDNHRAEGHSTENPQLSAALTQMSEAEVTRMLGTIESLQADLLRLIPLFNGEEPVEAVTYTQYLLTMLNDEINGALAIKQANVISDPLRNLDRQGAKVDYDPVLHLLSKMPGDKRRLTWTGMDGAE